MCCVCVCVSVYACTISTPHFRGLAVSFVSQIEILPPDARPMHGVPLYTSLQGAPDSWRALRNGSQARPFSFIKPLGKSENKKRNRKEEWDSQTLSF